MSEDREKELQRLIYYENQNIKQSRKNIKTYHDELKQINGEKVLKRKTKK